MTMDGESGGSSSVGGEGDGKDAGAAGAAAALLGADAGAAGDAGAGDKAADTAKADDGAKEGDKTGARWFDGLSDEAPDDKTLSDRKFIENKKFAEPGDMVKAYRALEAKLGVDKVPADPKGYDIPVPEGDDGAFASQFAEAAHKMAMPAPMAKQLAEWWNGQQAEIAAAQAAQVATDQAELRRSWGKDLEANAAIIDRAAERFGFKPEELTALRSALGTKTVAERMLAIGKAMGEDSLTGGGPRKMGGMSADEAKARKAEILADPEAMKKITAKDPVALAEWQKIAEAMAAELDQQKAA